MMATKTTGDVHSVVFSPKSCKLITKTSVCKRCKQEFTYNVDPTKGNKIVERDPHACRYHPESYAGETAQRWLDPGDIKDSHKVHYFWSCCGASEYEAPGCKSSWHITFEEEDTKKWM